MNLNLIYFYSYSSSPGAAQLFSFLSLGSVKAINIPRYCLSGLLVYVSVSLHAHAEIYIHIKINIKYYMVTEFMKQFAHIIKLFNQVEWVFLKLCISRLFAKLIDITRKMTVYHSL